MMDKLAVVSFVDWVVLFLLIVGLLQGWRKGLSGQLVELLSVGGALVLAWFLCRPVARFLAELGRLPEATAVVLAFFGLALLGYVIARLIRAGFQKLVEFKFKGALEPVGGSIAGLVLVALMLLVLIIAVDWLPQGRLRREVKELSVTGQLLAPVLRPVRQFVRHRFPELRAPGAPEPAAYGPGEEVAAPASEREELVPRAVRPIDEPRR